MDDLEGRIERGRHAIFRAKAEGKDTSSWEAHLSKLEKAKEYLINLRESKYQYLQEKIRKLSLWCNTEHRLQLYSKLIASEDYLNEEEKVDAAYLDILCTLSEFKAIVNYFYEFQKQRIK